MAAQLPLSPHHYHHHTTLTNTTPNSMHAASIKQLVHCCTYKRANTSQKVVFHSLVNEAWACQTPQSQHPTQQPARRLALAYIPYEW